MDKKYCVRAGYWHEYTGIGKFNDENFTCKEVCDELNHLQSLLDKEITTSKKAIDGLMSENNDLKHIIQNFINEKEILNQIQQDYEDSVSNWFIENWCLLSDEQRQSAHLELGIEVTDYD